MERSRRSRAKPEANDDASEAKVSAAGVPLSDNPVGDNQPAFAAKAMSNAAKRGTIDNHTHASGRPAPAGRRRGARDRRTNDPVYAALDLGTNNCRLLIARPTRRGFQVVDAFSRIIRLGEGVSVTGSLADAAIDRTMDALRVCATKMVRNSVTRSQLVATEACRSARNGEAFIERVRRDIGMNLEVLSQEIEAQLAVSGCASLIDDGCDHALVFDIGGGSSELIWVDVAKRRDALAQACGKPVDATACIEAWTSLPVGVVSLAEKIRRQGSPGTGFRGYGRLGLRPRPAIRG